MTGYSKWLENNAEDAFRKGNNSTILDTWSQSYRDFEAQLSKNTQHIMLLTTDEALNAVKDLYNYGTTFAGNIKDTISGAKNVTKLMSYREAEKLVFRFKGLGIKAETYIQKGVPYIKITGYASLRRILNGTRYAVNHPQILELGIGRAGINAGIMSGARFCIYFAAAQRVVEFIFSDHSGEAVAAFIGNITMDVAKVIVTIFVTKVLVAVGAGGAALLEVSTIIPVVVGIVLIVVVGWAITTTLSDLDEKYHLSEILIKNIHKGIKAHEKVVDWNLRHSNPYLFSMMNGLY